MSLLSAIVIPKLERELVDMEPYLARLLVGELKSLSAEVFTWAENKISGSAAPVPLSTPQSST